LIDGHAEVGARAASRTCVLADRVAIGAIKQQANIQASGWTLTAKSGATARFWSIVTLRFRAVGVQGREGAQGGARGDVGPLGALQPTDNKGVVNSPWLSDNHTVLPVVVASAASRRPFYRGGFTWLA